MCACRQVAFIGPSLTGYSFRVVSDGLCHHRHLVDNLPGCAGSFSRRFLGLQLLGSIF